MKLLGQHLDIKIIIRQILLNHINKFLHKYVICLFIFSRLLLQHQSFGINPFQAFALKNQILHFRFQHFRIERLHHIVVRPATRTLQYICIFCPGCQHQDRNMGCLLSFAYLPATSKSVFDWHHHVRNN